MNTDSKEVFLGDSDVESDLTEKTLATDDLIETLPADKADAVYKTMSSMIETLLNDGTMRDKAIKDLRADVDSLCSLFDKARLELESKLELETQPGSLPEFDKLAKKVEALEKRKHNTDCQKLIASTRARLLQAINSNASDVNDKISKLGSAQDIDQKIRAIVKEELLNMPSVEDKFRKFAAEYKSNMSRQLRRSTIQRSATMKTETMTVLSEINSLKRQMAKLQKKVYGLIDEKEKGNKKLE